MEAVDEHIRPLSVILHRYYLSMNLDKIIVGELNECWPWAGATNNGYGSARVGAKFLLVHRFVYELVYGKIPEGLTIDHLCENKICQNPRHLEAVSRGANVLRSASTITGANTRKECCPKCGGEYESEARPNGGWMRFCRSCRNARLRGTYWKRKAYFANYQRERRARIKGEVIGYIG